MEMRDGEADGFYVAMCQKCSPCPKSHDDLIDIAEHWLTRCLAAEKERDGLKELLLRIRGWDTMDIGGDGQYWKREIDKALSPTT